MGKISVVICVFNEEYCILNALRSLKFNKIYEDIEIIIVNDFSSNPITLRILQLLKKFDKYIIIHSPQNLGLSNSRNLGFEYSTSVYVMPLDADDTFPYFTIDLIYETFERNQDIDFVYGNYHIVDDQLDTIEISCESITTNDRIDLDKLLNNWILLGTSPCKKVVWEIINGYSLKYANTVQDIDFWIRALKTGVRGLYIPVVIYEWQRSLNGMNETFSRGDYYLMLEEHYAFIKKIQSERVLANKISEGFYKERMARKMITFNLRKFYLLNYKNILRPLLFIKNRLSKLK